MNITESFKPLTIGKLMAICQDLKVTSASQLIQLVESCITYPDPTPSLDTKDGKDEIKWHSDSEPQLGENPIIATVNLGATRTFRFVNKETGEKIAIPLDHGDLLMMHENCQKNYKHAILPEKSVKEPRISLTFRKVIS